MPAVKSPGCAPQLHAHAGMRDLAVPGGRTAAIALADRVNKRRCGRSCLRPATAKLRGLLACPQGPCTLPAANWRSHSVIGASHAASRATQASAAAAAAGSAPPAADSCRRLDCLLALLHRPDLHAGQITRHVQRVRCVETLSRFLYMRRCSPAAAVAPAWSAPVAKPAPPSYTPIQPYVKPAPPSYTPIQPYSAPRCCAPPLRRPAHGRAAAAAPRARSRCVVARALL